MGIGRSTFYDTPDARARDLTIVAEMVVPCSAPCLDATLSPFDPQRQQDGLHLPRADRMLGAQ
jgi:hypothetical protein